MARSLDYEIGSTLRPTYISLCPLPANRGHYQTIKLLLTFEAARLGNRLLLAMYEVSRLEQKPRCGMKKAPITSDRAAPPPPCFVIPHARGSSAKQV